MTAKNKNIPIPGPGKGKTVEDAAKALKQSQDGGTKGEDQGGAKSEDQGGEKKPGDEQPQPGQEGGGEAGVQADSGAGEGQAPGADGAQAGEPGSQEGQQPGPESQEGGAKSEEQGGTPGEDQGGPAVQDLSKEEEYEEMPTPVPDDAACEKFAKQLANSPAHLEAFRKTIAMADAMIVEKNKGPRKTVAELETANYNRLVEIYGKDFVTAKRGTNQGYFTRKTWNAMKNKRGWVETTKVMPEVAAPGSTEEVKA